MQRRRPRSTLFPYTTLFRSLEHAGAFDALGGDWEELHGNLEYFSLAAQQPREEVLIRALVCQRHLDRQRRIGDRKSTRLNSSHVESSYAVFCLKKKR